MCPADEFWIFARLRLDRAGGSLQLAEWSRIHSKAEQGCFELGVFLEEPSDDEEPPEAPLESGRLGVSAAGNFRGNDAG